MIVTTKYERPSISVPFFQRSSNVANYVKTTYEDTGKIQSSITHENNDLVRVFSITYRDIDAYNEYTTDDILIQEKKERIEYNKNNNIEIISIEKT